MRGVGFDYPNTCPRIDKQIDGAKNVMYRFVESLLEEACPLLSSETLQRLASENSDNLYRDLKDCFEVVRRTNEEMRSEADRQISVLQDRIADLEADLERAERQAA